MLFSPVASDHRNGPHLQPQRVWTFLDNHPFSGLHYNFARKGIPLVVNDQRSKLITGTLGTPRNYISHCQGILCAQKTASAISFHQEFDGSKREKNKAQD
jgi:hypothetical protein